MLKIRFFILVTLMLICAIAKNIDDHKTTDNVILVAMYVILILVGLYDLGKDEPDEK